MSKSRSSKADDTHTNRKTAHKVKPDKGNTNAKVCHDFRIGVCEYGISGKGCPRAHPPLCRRLMSHGTHNTRGCTKGNSCPRFHPKMCSSSVRYKKCLNDSCSSYHVKGTCRKNSRPKRPDASKNSERTHNQKKSPRHAASQNPKNEPVDLHLKDKETFLDLLETRMREVLNRLDAMDHKIAGAYRPQLPMAPQYQLPLSQQIPLMTQQPTRGYQLLPC